MTIIALILTAWFLVDVLIVVAIATGGRYSRRGRRFARQRPTIGTHVRVVSTPHRKVR